MLNTCFGSLSIERNPVIASHLPKDRKLNQAVQFAAVFREGKKHRCQYFTLIGKPNGLGYARLGMVVAKKVVRLATARNRIKRLLRESFRLNQHLIGSVDVVLVAHPDINRLDNVGLKKQLDQQWARLNSSAIP